MLGVLLAGEKTYRIPIRVKRSGWVGYEMGNASGDGFGAIFYIDRVLLCIYRQCSGSISEVSSNYNEFRNLVEVMEEHIRIGKLRDCEVFLLIDNLVVESSFYKGCSSSEMLFNLILSLRKL